MLSNSCPARPSVRSSKNSAGWRASAYSHSGDGAGAALSTRRATGAQPLLVAKITSWCSDTVPGPISHASPGLIRATCRLSCLP